jgi:hypothetical protein
LIKVNPCPEPSNFDHDVRKPGEIFLKKQDFTKKIKFRNYWKNISKQLRDSYQSTCAYTCRYLVSSYSVDHFLPKDICPQLAYEWSNYRLASQKVNNYKANSFDVIDPFYVGDNWFVIDFPSCLVVADDNLSPLVKERVEKTIEILRLNKDDDFVQARCDLMMHYITNDISFDFLSKWDPFLAKEVERQGIKDNAGDIFKERS